MEQGRPDHGGHGEFRSAIYCTIRSDGGTELEAYLLTLRNHHESEHSARSQLAADSVDGLLKTDYQIVKQLRRLSEADDDYWTFRRDASRRRAHGLTQYPAMMVPSMQAALLGTVAKADGRVRSVLDPFVGSGTTLVECMRLGLEYTGQDINPLAVLLCRTKAGPFHTKRLANGARKLVERIAADRGRRMEADFPGLEKWFSQTVARALSRIRRAIRSEENLWCRRVFWTALAETVRLSSNSRTSTFKLHIRSADDLDSRNTDPLKTFANLLNEIVERLQAESVALKDASHLSHNGWYRSDIRIGLGDSTDEVWHTAAGHDLLITSPPYGDNTSTVPYGQYSYLPLQWIDLHDIDEAADSSFLKSTHEIDSRSLGGSRKNAINGVSDLLPNAPSLKATIKRLEKLPVDRAGRVAAYFRDLNACLQPMLDALRPDAYMIWTVGNRQVGGKPIPTDAILTELLAANDAQLVTQIERKIPSKRMATRNNVAATMRGECILVFRKG